MEIIIENEHLTVFQSILYKTNSMIVQTKDFVLVVDPCWLHHEIAAIKHYVDKILNDRPLYLLFTHSDYDHILGEHYFKEAKVICSRAFEEHPNKQACLDEITKFCEKYYLFREYYATEYPKGDLVMDDGDSLALGDTTLHFYTAPGHTADGLFTFVEPLGIFIAGDYLSDCEFPFIYDSFKDFETTLEKLGPLLEKHQAKTMIQGHGNMATSREEMQSRIKKSQEYLLALKNHLLEEKPFNLKAWMESYPYPCSLEVEHVKNLKVVKKEFGLQN